MSHLLQLTLFGSPEIRLHGQPVIGFRSSKAQALLYYLAVSGRSHTRPTLAGLLWGEQPEDAARTSLSKCLSNLRDLVGDAMLIERQTVAFNRNQPYQLDTENFLAGIGQPPTPETIHTWQTALALYRGDFLEGFYVRDAPEFEQWVLVQRAHYREAALQGLYTLANWHDQQGDLPQAITHTRRLLTLEPWREEAHRQLMHLLARSGQRAAALAQFETCRRVLEEELSVEPDEETEALVEAIRADKIVVLSSPPVVVSSVPVANNNLPIPPTPLIGRERELAELGELINNPQCRLITITGPGGIGKTRLALAAAAEQSGKFQQGAVFVPLAGVSSAQFLPQAMLSALNVPLQGELSPEQQVRATLYNQERLLVFDNYEHLLPDVALLLDLLHYAPRLTLLVTSRERLALQAEYLHELTGLAYPHPSSTPSGETLSPAVADYAAIRLFLQRVRQIQPRFAPNAEEMAAIVRIGRISEGMPLALELAAAVVREQSCIVLATALEQGQARLSARLRDLPERHRTMTAVFDHSWQLLAPEEQQVLAALSLFRGGFVMEAAAQVANANPTILLALTDKSWLRCSPSSRYDIHELARQYANEQLVSCGNFDEVQNVYTQYFLRFVQSAKTGLEDAKPNEWMLQVEQELDNLRAVLKWLILYRPEDALRMIFALFIFWRGSGHVQEGYDWFRVALAHSDSVSPFVRANACIEAGFLAICKNEIAEGEELFAQSLALYQQLDATDLDVAKGLAYALNRQSLGPLFRGDYQQAIHLCRQSLAVAQPIGELYRASQCLYFIGEALYLQGLFDQSQHAYEESQILQDASGNFSSEGMRFIRLGHVVCAQGKLAQADTLFKKGLIIVAKRHDQVGTGMALIGLARMAVIRGDYQRATIITAAKEEMLAVNPIVRYWPMDRIENERTLTIIHTHLDDIAFVRTWAEGAAMSVEEAVAYALADPVPTLTSLAQSA
ncbi:MAG: BTAD domain-containing putative transcriptional regulator [Caldilineaceae bacterium]